MSLCLRQMHEGRTDSSNSPPRTPSEQAEPVSPQQNQTTFIDLEAMQVVKNGPSNTHLHADALESTQPKLFVCSGPWGSMHTPTAESQQLYEEMLPQMGKTAVAYLKAARGTHLGPASFAITCTEPLTPCRRKGCMHHAKDS